MKKRLENWQEGLWGHRKKKMTPIREIKQTTDNELFIGAAFCSDVPDKASVPIEQKTTTHETK